jgi:NADPH:quinone reductase-like Zn-dependent oxidoreductase
VRVEAISVNPVDVKVRAGVDPKGQDKVLGWDAAGTVLAVGPDATLIDDPAKPLPITKLKSKSASLHWEFMFTRARFETPDMIAQHHLLNEVADLVDAGVLRTTMKADLGPINAANLKRAHAQVESSRTLGKVVLSGF